MLHARDLHGVEPLPERVAVGIGGVVKGRKAGVVGVRPVLERKLRALVHVRAGDVVQTHREGESLVVNRHISEPHVEVGLAGAARLTHAAVEPAAAEVVGGVGGVRDGAVAVLGLWDAGIVVLHKLLHQRSDVALERRALAWRRNAGLGKGRKGRGPRGPRAAALVVRVLEVGVAQAHIGEIVAPKWTVRAGVAVLVRVDWVDGRDAGHAWPARGAAANSGAWRPGRRYDGLVVAEVVNEVPHSEVVREAGRRRRVRERGRGQRGRCGGGGREE